jgi:hypothetical protein
MVQDATALVRHSSFVTQLEPDLKLICQDLGTRISAIFSFFVWFKS